MQKIFIILSLAAAAAASAEESKLTEVSSQMRESDDFAGRRHVIRIELENGAVIERTAEALTYTHGTLHFNSWSMSYRNTIFNVGAQAYRLDIDLDAGMTNRELAERLCTVSPIRMLQYYPGSVF